MDVATAFPSHTLLPERTQAHAESIGFFARSVDTGESIDALSVVLDTVIWSVRQHMMTRDVSGSGCSRSREAVL